VEVAKVYGCPKAILVQRAADIDWKWLVGVKTLGLTAGASAPEALVDEVISAAKLHFNVRVEEKMITQENITFNIPRILREAEERVA
jgi:4-hydroxy-3-methylbut-2-en-1-yl diphosphate reductase